MAFAGDLGQVPYLSIASTAAKIGVSAAQGMEEEQLLISGGIAATSIGSGLAAGALWGSVVPGIGNIVGAAVGLIGGIVASIFGGGGAEKAERTAKGSAEFRAATKDFLNRGAIAYQDYDLNTLLWDLQMDRPDEMKSIMSASMSTMNDDLFKAITPYLTVIEAISVISWRAGYRAHVSAGGTTDGSADRAKMDQIKIYLDSKGINYPSYAEVADQLDMGNPIGPLFKYMDQVQEQMKINQGVTQALQAEAVASSGIPTTQQAGLSTPAMIIIAGLGAGLIFGRK